MTAVKTKVPRRSGFCNRSLPISDTYNPHWQCTMPDCCCDCHEENEMPKSGPPSTNGQYIHELVEEEREKIRYAAIWKHEQTNESKVTAGWKVENDAALFLEVMVELDLVDLSAELDVKSYVGEPPA